MSVLDQLKAELALSQAQRNSAQQALQTAQLALTTAQGQLETGLGELTDAHEVELTSVRAETRQDAFVIAATHGRELDFERIRRAEAERLGRIKDEFLANLSHEIRTPLNAILGWSQMLKPGETSEADLVEGLEVITRNARIQAKLIDDLLDMSRIISGKMRLDVQRVDLPAVIDAAMESVNPAAQAKGLKLQKVVDPIAGPITGDPNRLQQVVWNLLSNAIKFTPKGGSVQVVLERSNSHVELSVSDTGKGIAAEFLPHVFERFSQADNSSTRHYSGLGLGLAIVKSLAELHGGSVRVKSGGVDKGTTFIVSLPISVVHTLDKTENRQHAKFEHPSLLRAPNLKGIKVMVVDDEADAIHLVRRVMEASGATVEACTSAAECLECFPKWLPDVLITDIGMAEMDGYTLIEKIRAFPPEQGGQVPAIALTAFAGSEDRRRSMMAGFDIHVAKPVEPGELVAVVGRLGARRRT
jgi:signal transduction histidine kinase/ActR/RegA family two-component response regulator